MESVKLYYLAPSHYCEKARKILEFKGIPFDLVRVPYGNHQDVIEASGQDYVPFIEREVEEGVTWPHVPDWAEGVRPEPTLYPGGTRDLCRVLDHWAHQVVEEAVWRYVVTDVPPRLEAGQERWIFEEWQTAKRGPFSVLAARKPEFLEGVKEACGLAEGLLGSKDYLLGSDPSLADFALYGALHPLKFTGHEIPAEFAGLRSWLKRVDALGV